VALSHVLFDDINETHVNELIQTQRAESLYIEYKRETYGGSDKQHKEFLADISSFANAAGGDLIIGVDAAKGVPKSIVPFTADADAEVRRLEDMARMGLEPRIPNLQARQMPLSHGGYLILLRAPRSFLLPHRVSYQGGNRFWARSSGGGGMSPTCKN
jgi:Putative DNA-binding domain